MMPFRATEWKEVRIASTRKFRQWELLEDVFYKLHDNRWLFIKKGFITDGASIPRAFWVFYTPENPLWLGAAVVHDALYASELVSRSFADEELRRAMKLEGNNAVRRNIFWSGVRMFGWLTWKGHSKRSIRKARDFVSLI